MTWHRRYQLKEFFKSSFWLYPSFALLIAWLLAKPILWLIPDPQWPRFIEADLDGIRASMVAFASSMLTFIVYAVSALLLAVQLASGQTTPRLIRLTFSRWEMKVAASIFVFCLRHHHGSAGEPYRRNSPRGVDRTGDLSEHRCNSGLLLVRPRGRLADIGPRPVELDLQVETIMRSCRAAQPSPIRTPRRMMVSRCTLVRRSVARMLMPLVKAAMMEIPTNGRMCGYPCVPNVEL